MLGRIGRLEAQLRAGLTPLAELPHVGDVRVIGGVGIVELVSDKNDTASRRLSRRHRPALAAAFLERGLLLRPLGNIVYFMPPYVITDEEVEWALTQIEEVVTGAATAPVAIDHTQTGRRSSRSCERRSLISLRLSGSRTPQRRGFQRSKARATKSPVPIRKSDAGSGFDESLGPLTAGVCLAIESKTQPHRQWPSWTTRTPLAMTPLGQATRLPGRMMSPAVRLPATA